MALVSSSCSSLPPPTSSPYTVGVIGADLAVALLFLSLAFGIGIGLIMVLLFRHGDVEHDKTTDVDMERIDDEKLIRHRIPPDVIPGLLIDGRLVS